MNEVDGIGAYGLAWLEPDPQRRAELLDRAWAPDAIYCDPTAWVQGRAALSDHIGAVQASLPGHRVQVTAEAARHHDSATFPWQITAPDDSVLMAGFDVVQLDDHGRITRLTGFFTP